MTDHTRLGAYGLQKNLALQSALLNPNVRQVLELLNKSNPMVMPSSRDNNFRYSVEQIWLLQRLRSCGLTRDQILSGLDDLDRLDGTSQHAAATPSFSGFQPSCVPTPRPHSNGSDQSKSPAEAIEAEKINTGAPTVPRSAPSNFDQILKKNLNQAAAAMLNHTMAKPPLHNAFSMWANRATAQSAYPSLGHFGAGAGGGGGVAEDKPGNKENTFRRDEPDDLADELDQIQRAIEHCERRNQHEVKEEIRVFTQRHHISQTAISKATHQAISQSYISQWLTSNITMGDAKRRIIYEWFCRQKRRLEGHYPGQLPNKARLLGLTNNSLLHNTQMQGDFGGSTSPPNQGTVMTRKPRQRIMWPIKCLQFLDGAFSKNPYPGSNERSQLVLECNALLGDERNVEITELHVANWFRNRRKVKKVIDVNGPKSAEHLAVEQDLIEMQDAESEFDRNGSGVGAEIDVDETIKSEPHSGNGDSKGAIECEVEEIRSKSPAQADYLQTKNGLVRASILPAATTSQEELRRATQASSLIFTSSLLQSNAGSVVQNTNMNGRMEA